MTGRSGFKRQREKKFRLHGHVVQARQQDGRAEEQVEVGELISGSAESQFTLLHDNKVQTSQRQSAARFIGETRGNHHLEAVLSVQRALSAEETAQNLQSPRFAGVERLEQAFDNAPLLRAGARGEPVRLIQQALVDDGFPMPGSTKEDGSLDGVFGAETTKTIKLFQQTYNLAYVDGVVGRGTMGKLDELYTGTPQPVPPTVEPEIGVSDEELGKHIVSDMEKANQPNNSADSGIWYASQFETMHAQNPEEYPWEPDWVNGYADPAYFDRIDFMQWILKPGVSASAGLKSWLKGRTIAECNSTLVAMEYDTFRAAVGDKKFDDLFGSADIPSLPQSRLLIRPGVFTTPLAPFMKYTEAAEKGDEGTYGNRPVKLGDWGYFYNHPKYLLKHPGGAFQGENAIYAGNNEANQQLWSGLGINNVTEDGMLDAMVGNFNEERDYFDYKHLVKNEMTPAPPEAKLDSADFKSVYFRDLNRVDRRFRHDLGEFPDKIDRAAILNEEEYELWNTKRKGGYVAKSSKSLDAVKVKAVRES